jgi:hypothetical protein
MLMHALHGNHDGHQPAASNSNESLLDLLKRRYALGEISDAQFEQMKRALGLAVSTNDSAQANVPVVSTNAGHHSES